MIPLNKEIQEEKENSEETNKTKSEKIEAMGRRKTQKETNKLSLKGNKDNTEKGKLKRNQPKYGQNMVKNQNKVKVQKAKD